MKARISSPLRRLFVLLLLPLTGWSPEAKGANAVEITGYSHSANGFQLAWSLAGTGQVYTVQSTEALVNGVWLQPRTDQPWPISLPEWFDTRPAAGEARFYRVLAVPEAQRGQILSTTLEETLSHSTLSNLFTGLPITPEYDVRLYKVVYETIEPTGARTWASGALVLPVGVGSALPLVSYQHGTITRTNDAPSRMNLLGEVTIGVAFATTGYAAAVPDLLGLGDSPGLHPYHHATSEATACIDMLRAVRTFCATNGTPLTNRLFLCGYSQGGHTTMALARDLETYYANEFSVTACAPMAGAYDLSGVTTEDVLSGRLPPNPYYFAYLLAAYQDVYHFAPEFADLLEPPYDITIPPLFHGNTTGGDINTAMPTDPTQILKPEILAAFRRDPNHPFRQALRDNDVYAWTPTMPMRLYHCSGDQDVVYANSEVALASFQSRGATQVTLTDTVPGGDHGDCVLPSLLEAKTWFDSLR